VLVGTADLDELAASAPTVHGWLGQALDFDDVTCLQVIAELRRPAREPLLPPGLHPTEPPALSLQAWRVGSSPWGPFSWVLARLSCRSGVRARGFSIAALASTDAAAAGLRDHVGFPCRVGDVHLSVFYDAAELDVVESGHSVLSVRAIDATPLGVDDVQYTGTMNLAHTPQGLRLVQVETDHHPTHVQRLRARFPRFVPAAWGSDLLDPYHVVSATVARESVTIPPMRFVCRADVPAFEGTEKIA
jgi:hypothetical protein